MEKPTVINGQPQGLGNRMVTWDGLNDFFNMLKNEIPRMGVNNIAGSYSYSLGQNNKDYSRLSFLVGDGNKVNVNEKEYSYLNYVFGSNNHVNGGKYTFTFGSGNMHTVAEDKDTLACSVIFGNSNLNKGQLCFLAGTHNRTDQAASYTYVFGKENYGGEDSNKKSVGIRLFNGFIVGHDNQISGPILSNGSPQNERIYVFGSGHKIHNARGIVCFGDNNTVNNGKKITYNTFLCGSNLTGWYQGTTPAYILGQYNDVEYDEDGNVIKSAALMIGDGVENARSNLLVIGYDGEFRLKNGYFSQPITFKNDLRMYGDNGILIKTVRATKDQKESVAAKFAPGDITFYHGLTMDNVGIGVNNANIGITNAAGESVAKFAPNGTTFSHNVQFNNPDSFVIYGAGFDATVNAQQKAQMIYYNHVRIIDGGEAPTNLAPVIYYDHGFRHMLHAWQDPDPGEEKAIVNEAFWTIRNITQDQEEPESILHINYSSPEIFKQDIENRWAQHYVPKEIHFHAGEPDNWADIHCGAIDCGAIDCSLIDCSGEIDCTNVKCSTFSMDDKTLKQAEDQTDLFKNSQLPQGLLLIRIGVWHNLTKLGTGAMCMYHYGDAFGLGTQLSAQTNNTATNFSFYCQQLDRIMYCSATMQWTSTGVMLSIQLDSEPGTDTGITKENVKFRCAFIPLLTANGVLES